ncbi:hypothetical protein OEW28_09970 [Defluviimonas sp. WL0002]|uniref:Uncharacterized protein n=1 Tax=Albidovulum marisflavi TaxID=2984159 RepID=A0ABT2ZCZ2_9RHOB|nr:hypothetical protein [Defluviimonas sp. WL0002]MCV2868956.1 hypothetical protein [Defluviimonas sp. WL0002]
MPSIRGVVIAAALFCVSGAAAQAEVLECQFADYRGDGKRALAESVVPRTSTLILDGLVAQLKETGVSGGLTFDGNVFRIEMQDRMPAPVSGDAKIIWEIKRSNGEARVRTRAVRQNPWDDFPERNGIFIIKGRCSAR